MKKKNFILLPVLSLALLIQNFISIPEVKAENSYSYEIDKVLVEIEGLLQEEVEDTTDEINYFISRVNASREETNEILSKVGEDFYNSDQFQLLMDKRGELDIKIDAYINPPKTLTRSSLAEWRYGDILYYGMGSDNAVGEKSYTGHTAVLSTTTYYVIEASKTTSNGSKVHHWNRNNLWKGATGIKQYKETRKLGTDANYYERQQAVDYGLRHIGQPYKLKTAWWTEDEWYCSKLTNAQWSSVGYDLRSASGLTIGGFLIVTPGNIISDLNVRMVKNWGSQVPGLL